MSGTRVISTCQELYDLVWSIPMWTLAKHMGYSDKGIAKVCARNNVSCPPKGYWQKLKAGFKVKRTPLPVNKISERLDYDYQFTEDISGKDTKKIVVPIITVSDTLRGAHPLVALSMKLLNTIGKKPDEIILPPPEKCLDIKVTKGNKRRALLIMDALIKALEQMGHEVSVKNGLTYVSINEVDIQLCLLEINDAIYVKSESRLFGHPNPSKHNCHNYKHVPSGRLCLEIENGQYAWKRRDNKRRQLEDALADCIEGIINSSVRKKEHLRKREEENRIHEEQKQLEALRQLRIKEEKTKISNLVKQSEQWQQAKIIRENLSEVERQIKLGNNIKDDGWLQWAHGYADSLDPISPESPPIQDVIKGGES